MSEPVEKPPIFNSGNVLVLIGILVTIVGLVYFASELIDRLSEWGKLAILLLLTAGFVSLGRYFEDTSEGEGRLFSAPRLRWARLPAAMYILGAVGALVSVIFFVGMDEVPKAMRAAITIGAGVLLILSAARFRGARAA